MCLSRRSRTFCERKEIENVMNENSVKWGKGEFQQTPKEERLINMLEFKALRESFNVQVDIDKYGLYEDLSKPYGYGVEDWDEIREEFN